MFMQGFRSLWSHEKLLNMVEQLLGTSDISGSPVWNIRPKTPKNASTVVPWHQGVWLTLSNLIRFNLHILFNKRFKGRQILIFISRGHWQLVVRLKVVSLYVAYYAIAMVSLTMLIVGTKVDV